jgi:putative methionine-R-sulfoxide reductase with GAF domain
MEHFSIFGHNVSSEAPVAVPLPAAKADKAAALPPVSPDPLRFPGDDGGKSLAEMAEQDLEAALQLLAERAQYITGASGAAIGLCEGKEMVCRASAGPCAPAVGAQLQIHSGLTGESVRARQVLRCDDAETDPRVNRESCRAMGIRSVMVLPLMREQEVIGVFELLASRPQAFEERDVTALERLAEMILTALDHADAAKRALREIAEALGLPETELAEMQIPVTAAVSQVHSEVAPDSREPAGAASATESPIAPAPVPISPRLNIKTCTSCGFPVSQGRTICLDCEAALGTDQKPAAATGSGQAPAFLAQLASETAKPNWLHSHFYTIAALLMAAATVAIVLLYLR